MTTTQIPTTPTEALQTWGEMTTSDADETFAYITRNRRPVIAHEHNLAAHLDVYLANRAQVAEFLRVARVEGRHDDKAGSAYWLRRLAEVDAALEAVRSILTALDEYPRA
jgi:hypothetical protein